MKRKAVPTPPPLAVPSPDWTQARCRTMDPDVFFDEADEKNDVPSPLVLATCRLCPIQNVCLDWAIATKQRHGMWGATTPRQREKIGRPITRASCPGCFSQDLLDQNDVETCISCGLSWSI
jgi:hypothetical protein